MLGKFKPVAFEPYGRRRGTFRVPPWLVLLLLGGAGGAGAVLFVQERMMPPRLSSAETTELRARLAQLETDNARQKADLAATNQQLQATQAERSTLANDLAADRERTKSSREDFDFLVASLPADPRGGAVEVRAARLVRQRGALGYEVLLTRGKNAPAQVGGVMQFVVTGLTNGVERHLTLEPIKINVTSHQSLRGSLPLPETFTPKLTTVNVLDKVGGKSLGMRVLYVQS
ncbi:MAG: DUF6776 family protein [Burkholderiaceae bacterium]